MKLLTLVAAISACVSAPVLAQTERDLDSHEHGSALLNVAIDGNTLIIELESPWNNLIGFEHEPRTEEQHELVDNAMEQLNEAESLFAFNGTECAIADAMIESTLGEDDHHDDEHGDEHHDDEHKDDHDDEHHDDEHGEDEKAGHDDDDHDDEHHDDEHSDADHDDEGETHSSVRASYSFDCSTIAELDAIDVKLLGVWSGFEELDVQMVGPSGQGGAELTPNAAIIDVTGIR